MGKSKERTDAKPRIIRWGGLLTGRSRQLRLAIAVSAALTCATFTFTQLGFVGIGMPDGSTAYIVSLLPVVALGALLLGTGTGTLLGLIAGVILYAHSKLIPLNHIELLYVTPLTSVAMLGMAGLTLGILYAFALRHNPSQVKRVIYITIVSTVVAFFYSITFIFNVMVMLIVQVAIEVGSDVTESYLDNMLYTAADRMGDMGSQIWITALIMSVVCCVNDWAARRLLGHQGTYGVRYVFGSWLAVAVALSFMAMAATGFAVTTSDQLNDAERDMKGEVEYFVSQITASNEQSNRIFALFEDGGYSMDNLDVDQLLLLANASNSTTLLQNYDPEENGIVITTFGPLIDLSNSPQFGHYDFMAEACSEDLLDAVDASMETGRLQRFVMDNSAPHVLDEDVSDATPIKPYLAYLMAKSFELENAGGQTHTYGVIVIKSSDQVFAPRGPIMTWLSASTLVLMLIVGAIVFLLLNRLVAQRIDEENAALDKITEGDLTVRATAGGTSEFESLTNGINKTVNKLQGLIAEAETRMDAELATAKAIQESALPRTFPPYPDILKFDIYASMKAAREVGGDFYDFFLVGDDNDNDSGKLAFVVADVSGKGVPGALFMMKAKALLRDYIGSGMELGEAVSEANNQICEGNEAGMFVTAWVGVLDYGTGHVDFVNAGHNPPLLWAFDDPDASPDDKTPHTGGWRWLSEKSGLPLGLFDGMPYTAHSLDTLPGDTFLLYTDGVTEAMDVDGKLYGEDRLMELARQNYLLHPRKLQEAVKNDVAAHAAGAEQSDDITILALEVGVPPEITATLEVPATVDQLDAVNDFLHAELDRRLCPRRVQHQLDLVVEELFVNVCRYAYPDSTQEEPGSIIIQRTYSSEPPCIVVDLIDDGVPFDPLAKPDTTVPNDLGSLDVEDIPIGGLGIFLVKNSVDEIRYERQDNSNIVTIVKKW